MAAAAGAALSVALALSSSTTGDYVTQGGVSGDNAGPAIAALSQGDVHGFLARQPFMGLTSLLLRVPLEALASLLRGGNTFSYALGAMACLIPAALLAVWMITACSRRCEWFPAVVAALILLVSPVTLDAVQSGHPEEMLASVLATAAVLAARRGADIWAALLLGLAVGTKQWAVLAAVPVLATQPRERIRTAVIATASALILSAAAPLADLAAFARASRLVGGSHTANIASAWWPLSSPLRTPVGVSVAPTARWLPLGLGRSEALLIVLAVVVAGLALVVMSRKERRGLPVDGLALLALLGLVRCMGDPGDLRYYLLSAIVPMTAWEVLSLRRVPIAAVLAVAAASLTFDWGARLSPTLLNGLMIAWMLAIGCYLARGAFSPHASRKLPPQVEIRTQAQASALR